MIDQRAAIACTWVAAGLVGALVLCPDGLAFAAQAPVAACPTTGETAALIVAVEPRLELRLADGRLVRLAGIDPAAQTPEDPDLAETARGRISSWLAGKTVTLRLLAASPDRWGRLPAQVFAGGDPAGGIGTRIVAMGLARHLAEPAAHACHDVLVRAESRARSAKLGLWADPYYAVLAVDDRAGFMERSGTLVLAEGLVSAVQPGPYRTTLRFAAPRDIRKGQDRAGHEASGPNSYGGHMLVATILPRVMKSFEAQSVDVKTLIGRRVRCRGLLDLRFGPRIELASPDDVEMIEAPAEAAPTHSN